MERIKKALERARADGTAVLPVTVGAPSLRAESAESPTPLRRSSVSPVQAAALEQHRIIARDKRAPGTVAFDVLRTQILREMRQKHWRTLGVTSPTPECGKTTVAINLALSIAQQKTPSVLLADFDLRRPKISDYLGMAPEHDLSDFLDGRTAFATVLVDPQIPGLSVLPNRRGHDNATEMLMMQEVRDLVTGLKSEVEERVIILDLPPVLNTDDTLAFLPQVDCVLLVVADRFTRKDDLEAALRLMNGSNLIGTVLNKSTETQQPYY